MDDVVESLKDLENNFERLEEQLGRLDHSRAFCKNTNALKKVQKWVSASQKLLSSYIPDLQNLQSKTPSSNELSRYENTAVTNVRRPIDRTRMRTSVTNECSEVETSHVPVTLESGLSASSNPPVESRSQGDSLGSHQQVPADTRDDPDIPYRFEHGVVVLLPSKLQCRNMTLLMAQAQRHGARETGVFKFVLPDGVELGTQVASHEAAHVSRFKSQPDSHGHLCISRTEYTETLDMDDSDAPNDDPIEPDQLADAVECKLTAANAITKMRYWTDAPARTDKERRRLGLPRASPIWPLADNQLEFTKYSVPGLHTPFGYLSGKHGAVFTMHHEDKNLSSLNCLYRGTKLWIVIAPKDSPLIENSIKPWTCSQKVRHASRYILRRDLITMGASFVSFAQNPREVVMVWGDAYHQGGTRGCSQAEAINYAPPGWTANGSVDCDGNCPKPQIPNHYLDLCVAEEPQREQGDEIFQEPTDSHRSEDRQPTNRSDAETTGAQSRQMVISTKRGSGEDESRVLRNRKRTRTEQLPAMSDLEKAAAEMREIESTCRIPPAQHPRLTAKVLKLVMAISSRSAIAHFYELVRTTRDLNANVVQQTITGDLHSRLVQCVKGIRISEGRSLIEKLAGRMHQAKLVNELERENQGRLRTETAVTRRVSKETGLSSSQLKRHLHAGRRWNRIRADYDGLLCFILDSGNKFDISPRAYVDMNQEDLESFLGLLKNDSYISALCSAGQAFQETMDSTAPDREFSWEQDQRPLLASGRISDEQLLSYIKPLPKITENILVQNVEWCRPDGWPEEWPWDNDPLWLPPNAIQCDLCPRTECDCIEKSTENPNMPRIKDYGKMGRGLQAIASTPGGRAYKKGEYIGELMGEIKPLGSHDDEWTLEVVRNDLPDEPKVGLMYCKEKGNYFRLLNHACDLNYCAQFIFMTISGKYRLMVEAVREIQDREQITVCYGPAYFEEGECFCSAHSP